MMWGMSGFEEEEEDRPEFEGETISSPVTGEDETYFPEEELHHVYLLSCSVLAGVSYHSLLLFTAAVYRQSCSSLCVLYVNNLVAG